MEISPFNIPFDEYFAQLSNLSSSEEGPVRISWDHTASVQIHIEEWEEETYTSQEVVLADNIQGTRLFYEKRVKEIGGFTSPRDSFNRWLFRSLLKQYDKVDFDADTQLRRELVEHSPAPFTWVEDKRQLFNYIQVYIESTRHLRDRGWIPRIFYSEIIKVLSELKKEEFDVKLIKLKALRRKVSDFIENRVATWVNPMMRQMKEKLFKPGTMRKLDYLVPRLLYDRHPRVEYMYNCYLYHSLVGIKGKGFQIRVSSNVYEMFPDYYIEAFASPANAVKSYHSIFDSDKRWGSKGSIYRNYDPSSCYLMNPPYMRDYIDDMFERFYNVRSVVAFLLKTDENMELVRAYNYWYTVIPKDRFGYEQIYEKNSPPGKPIEFKFYEDTLIVWWGTDYSQKKIVNDIINKI